MGSQDTKLSAALDTRGNNFFWRRWCQSVGRDAVLIASVFVNPLTTVKNTQYLRAVTVHINTELRSGGGEGMVLLFSLGRLRYSGEWLYTSLALGFKMQLSAQRGVANTMLFAVHIVKEKQNELELQSRCGDKAPGIRVGLRFLYNEVLRGGKLKSAN